VTDVTTTAKTEPAPRVPGRKRRIARRITRWTLAGLAAIVAAALTLVFTIDLGRFSAIKTRAERAASNYLERPMRIGRLSAVIAPGVFALDDVVIEGKHAGDRPFFSAGRIFLYVPWWTILLRNELHVEVGLTDWRMVVETCPEGACLPRLTPRTREPSGPPRFTTTVRSVYASRGEFIYEDHGTPWSVRAPNLSFALVRAENLRAYVGRADFSGGTVQIQQFKPMWADMSTRFVLDGPRVTLRHIDLTTDGAVSHVNGFLDFSRWPEQTYNVHSTVDFARMREIFFSGASWRLGGTGEFTGVFRLFKDGRELAGEFTSDEALVNDVAFPNLHGSLIWTRDHFAVTHGDADLLDGEARFSYTIAPLGRPTGSTATFTADYTDLDLAAANRLFDLESLELAGRASGNLSMSWPNGRFGAARRGKGHTLVTPPPDVTMAAPELPAEPRPPSPEPVPFAPDRPLGPMAVSADVDYVIDPDGWSFDDSWAATTHTYVRFNGRLATAGSSEFPFHVTSHDWQESDRVLARIMTAVAGRTGAIEVGGRGTFDGAMTGTFRAPHIAGRFAGEATRVWDVTWGRAAADVVIAGGYVDIANSRFGDLTDAWITADGRFALGFRKDAAEEINARVVLHNWPMADLRHAFDLDDWPMEGTIGEATLQLRGRYKEMYGSGKLRIDNGAAWRERFETASGDLELEGTGIRIHRIDLRKGPGVVRGDARIGWNGTYAFNADGENILVESLDRFKLEQAPLSGGLRFKASGAGEFDTPRYTFSGSVDDLFIGDQGIGRVQGQLSVEGRTLRVERLVASSSLLDVDGRGTITLNDQYDGNLHLRFTESSFDPYLRFFAPALAADPDGSGQQRLPTRIILSGSLDAEGPFGRPLDLSVATSIDDATLTLFDYDLRNDGPVLLAYRNEVFRVGQLKLTGADTNLELTGGADVRQRSWNVAANGSASLSILQAFPLGITASGGATVNAALQGSFDAPQLTGAAVIANGRLRPLASPHSLEAVNGPIRFDDAGVRIDGVTGRIGAGDVTFGGTITREGYRLAEYNLTARGRSMTLRYPRGFNSTVNTDLVLTGPLRAPRLTGRIDVLRVRLTGGGDPAFFGLAAAGTAGAGTTTLGGGATATLSNEGTPIVLDIQVSAPRIRFIDTRTAQIEGTADLHVGGTFDRPAITGSIDIVRGEWLTPAGNRLYVREGSIDFTNPDRVEPFFNISADTRPRVSGQTFDINVQISGTPSSLRMNFTSDPPLPDTEILALLLGGTPNVDTAALRALRSPQESQQLLIQTAAAYLLASPISSRVEQVFERAGALDIVQITPVLIGEVAFQQLNPSARITLGKRISQRVFLTYSRTLGTTAAEDEIILLEYDQNDRVSWILSRNEDRSFALDFRIRYVH
jgi:hypothetical protein